MLVFLIRHGKAQPDSPTGRDDDRELRGRGRRQAAYLAGRLAEHTTSLSRLISSGLIRAEQTAEPILASVPCAHETEPSLGDFFDASPPESIVRRCAHDPAIAIVGHNEQLSMALARWVGYETAPMRTGECAVLRVEDPDADTLEVTLLDRWRLDED